MDVGDDVAGAELNDRFGALRGEDVVVFRNGHRPGFGADFGCAEGGSCQVSGFFGVPRRVDLDSISAVDEKVVRVEVDVHLSDGALRFRRQWRRCVRGFLSDEGSDLFRRRAEWSQAQFVGELVGLVLEDALPAEEERKARVQPHRTGGIDGHVARFVCFERFAAAVVRVEPLDLLQGRVVFRYSAAGFFRADVDGPVLIDIQGFERVGDPRFEWLDDRREKFAAGIEDVDVRGAGDEQLALVDRVRIVDREVHAAGEFFFFAARVVGDRVAFDVGLDRAEVGRFAVELEAFDLPSGRIGLGAADVEPAVGFVDRDVVDAAFEAPVAARRREGPDNFVVAVDRRSGGRQEDERADRRNCRREQNADLVVHGLTSHWVSPLPLNHGDGGGVSCVCGGSVSRTCRACGQTPSCSAPASVLLRALLRAAS